MDTRNLSRKQELEYLFHPRSIAIVGVSTDMKKAVTGRLFLESLTDADFKGRLYPVNRGGGKIFGTRVYPALNDIPDSVDYVISAIPAKYNPQLLLDCARKGARAVHIFSSGFSEIADEDGLKLEEQLTQTAHQAGIRIIGPNCMGLYYPKGGLSFNLEFPRKTGPVGFISQSGSNAVYAIREGAMKGVYFSKAISYGNACDLNECDFLEYLTHDPETTIIAGYIEGVKEGLRFIKVLKEAAQAKPVIIYKAGNTEPGIRAVTSHTGTLAGSDKVWSALLKQAGALQVNSMAELVDVLMLFTHMSPPRGRNMALIGAGGGAIVQSTDECVQAGLNLPPLPPEIRRELEKAYTTEAGGSFRNPIDLYLGRRDLIEKTIKTVADCEQIDLLVTQVMIGLASKNEPALYKPYLAAINNLSRVLRHRTAIVLLTAGERRFLPSTQEIQQSFVKAGYPVYESASRAANAINKFIGYHQRLKTG